LSRFLNAERQLRHRGHLVEASHPVRGTLPALR
jgi:hypothetical protein